MVCVPLRQLLLHVLMALLLEGHAQNKEERGRKRHTLASLVVPDRGPTVISTNIHNA